MYFKLGGGHVAQIDKNSMILMVDFGCNVFTKSNEIEENVNKIKISSLN